MGRKKMLLSIISMLSIMFIMFLGGCGEKEDNTKVDMVIKIGSNRAIGTITPYLAEELKYFENREYQIEIIEFSDGASLMEAMAAGELDIGIVGISPVATWNEKGLDVRVVASANGGGHVILSTKERDFSSVEDLKGKKIAGPSPGTVTDTLLRSYVLPKYSLSADDLTIVTGMSGADMVTSLENADEVDAVVTWEPFVSMAELTYDNIQVLFDASEEWMKDTGKTELYPVNVIAATGEFCDKHDKVLEEILQVIKKTVEYVEKNPEEAYQKIAKLLDLDVDVVEQALQRSQLTYDVDIEATMETLNWAYELGYLKRLPEKEELFDLKYLTKK